MWTIRACMSADGQVPVTDLLDPLLGSLPPPASEESARGISAALLLARSHVKLAEAQSMFAQLVALGLRELFSEKHAGLADSMAHVDLHQLNVPLACGGLVEGLQRAHQNPDVTELAIISGTMRAEGEGGVGRALLELLEAAGCEQGLEWEFDDYMGKNTGRLVFRGKAMIKMAADKLRKLDSFVPPKGRKYTGGKPSDRINK